MGGLRRSGSHHLGANDEEVDAAGEKPQAKHQDSHHLKEYPQQLPLPRRPERGIGLQRGVDSAKERHSDDQKHDEELDTTETEHLLSFDVRQENACSTPRLEYGSLWLCL